MFEILARNTSWKRTDRTPEIIFASSGLITVSSQTKCSGWDVSALLSELKRKNKARTQCGYVGQNRAAFCQFCGVYLGIAGLPPPHCVSFLVHEKARISTRLSGVQSSVFVLGSERDICARSCTINWIGWERSQLIPTPPTPTLH